MNGSLRTFALRCAPLARAAAVLLAAGAVASWSTGCDWLKTSGMLYGSGQARGGLLVLVLDADGNPVEGANVSIWPLSIGDTTGEKGTVLFEELPAEVLRVSAHHTTLGQATDAVRIYAGDIARLSLALEPVASISPRPAGGQAGSAAQPSTSTRAGAPARAGSGGRGGSGGGQALPPPGEYIDVATQVETMLLDPERPYLYALDRVNNSLHFVNLDKKAVEKSLFVGSSPVDMDLSADGMIFVANFGSTEIAVVDAAAQQVARTMFVDTSQGTWDGNPYRLAVTAFDTFAFTSEDQWNNIKLVNAANGGHIAAVGSIYSPDLVASPDGTRLYVAEFGGSGALTRFEVSATNLVSVDTSAAMFGSGARVVVLSGNGEFVFYSSRKFLANNLKSVLGTFAEPIFAANEDGSLAIGKSTVFNGETFDAIRRLPIATTVMALSKDASSLYLYDEGSSRIYIEDLSDL